MYCALWLLALVGCEVRLIQLNLSHYTMFHLSKLIWKGT